ncbi:putative caffeine synthase [Helianthus annuus]|uniref:Caffeine synthase n=1 Tax=Helianthus annuus TaxID=4232 RepID=A0A251SPQ1_HELAN|nr:putative caffeine synthase [Helianthus annuus]
MGAFSSRLDEPCFRLGLVEKEKIDSFNAPYYAPSPEEVKCQVENEGSFVVVDVKSFGIEWDAGDWTNCKI